MSNSAESQPASTPPPHAAMSPTLAYLILGSIIVLWGVNWPIMKMSIAVITPLWFVFARLALGCLCLFGIVAATGRLALPERADWPIVVSVGWLQMALYMALVNIGLAHTPAGRASLIAYSMPIWVVPCAFLVLKERITPLKLAGVVAGICGVAALFNPAALDILHSRRHRWQSSPLALAPWQMLIALPPLIVAASWIEGWPHPLWSPTLTWILIYNGPLATAFCFWAVVSVQRALPASTASVSFLGVPVCGIASATLALDEPIGLDMWLGGGLVLVGVALTAIADWRRRA
jgi:drug/metabolite transporter (DMT)-like permease